MLTLDQFNQLPDGEQFATGTISDNEFGIDMNTSNELLRFVAVKGYADDWCVYCHFATYGERYISECGDKITFEVNIRRVVPCDDEVFARYRC